ncbi:hypothetical protein HNP46_006508 [Pseudomonas nitritireducens]|uniref:MvaT DNA-binding domain-containing protein n=1 Tax=Pseudomonas nitroreducens TaxID=46680 RepID=A0A7W7KS48_PSENT|nr:histone-like nucleoid-structuring protein, MvaT/MvaU family [Pseudomonas nitritireducens]MBB4867594.1 hypothetical protein [Pseudomonas nitritireducens]
MSKSLISTFRTLEEEIRVRQAQLDDLRDDPALKKEMEFEEKLRALMTGYSKSLKDIVAILDPTAKVQAAASNDGRKTRNRKVKQYKNPETGEIIETKGGNHKTLKEWKAKWGGEAVESWATILD